MKKFVYQSLPLIMIFAAYLAFAGYRLRMLPGEWYGDISIEQREVSAILGGGWPWRFAESAGPAYHYVVAAFAKVLGQSFETYKLASLFTGLVVVGLVYLLGKELAGRRVGLLAALAAALSTWLIIFARLGSSPQILTPLLSAGAVYFLARFRREPAWRNVLFSMCFAGLGLFTYPATFILPLVVVALIGWQILFTRPRLIWWQALLLAVVTMAPFTLWFIRLAETTPAFGQGGYVGEKLAAPGQHLAITALAFGTNMLRALGMFQFTGDNAFRTNVANTPVLDPVSGVLLGLGLAWLLLNPRLRPRWAYLIAPIVILLAPSADPALPRVEIPSASRALAAAPFVYILVALGLDAAWLIASRLIAARRPIFEEEAEAEAAQAAGAGAMGTAEGVAVPVTGVAGAVAMGGTGRGESAERGAFHEEAPTQSVGARREQSVGAWGKARATWARAQSWAVGMEQAGPVPGLSGVQAGTASLASCWWEVLAAGLALAVLVVGIGSFNVSRYFGAYAQGLPEHNQAWGLQIAQLIDAQPAGTVVKIVKCCWGEHQDPDPESIYYVLQHPQGREYLLTPAAYATQCSALEAGKRYLLIFPPNSPEIFGFQECFPQAQGQSHLDALGQQAFYSMIVEAR